MLNIPRLSRSQSVVAGASFLGRKVPHWRDLIVRPIDMASPDDDILGQILKGMGYERLNLITEDLVPLGLAVRADRDQDPDVVRLEAFLLTEEWNKVLTSDVCVPGGVSPGAHFLFI